jgi:eukaryotic-like serine/threonine-protein kinase
MSDPSLTRTGIIPVSTEEDSDRAGKTSDMGASADTHRVRPPVANGRALERIGSYRIIRKLGEGGMGAVYLGEHESSGATAAIKVLPREFAPDAAAIKRFQKEARLLAEVKHDNVANLIEVGEDGGDCYLVMDFVNGTDVKHVLAFQGPMQERLALQVTRDVAAALAAAHDRGIIHRDVKPANILIEVSAIVGDYIDGVPPEAVAAALVKGASPIVKLSDFGLARHTDQSASMDMTRTGAMVGTPYYIAPEQCVARGEIGPATDVYSLGVTLFEMLTGRPPFIASDPVRLISAHCFEEPPDVKKLNPAISDAASRLVARTLQKSPALRHANAHHLLAEIERLIRGETTDVAMHPRVAKSSSNVVETLWEWQLEASPEQLWPMVSNTDRINAAIGLPAVEYTTDRDEQGAIRKHGMFRLGFATLKWQEHPFEWVEGRRLGVLREFEKGPFEWFLSIVELSPRAAGGTHLKHTVRIATRNVLGRVLAWFEVKVKGSRGLDRVYRRIDSVVSGRLKGSTVIDPFEPSPALAKTVIQKFEARQDDLERASVDQQCADALLQFLQESPAAELARIRPQVIARRLKLPVQPFVEACIRACHVGLLELHWDILCPTCRVSSGIADTLAAIDRHTHCEACDLDFEVDFGNAIELIFRVHPDLRQAELKTYCIGGPEHAPHVIAQARLAPGEALELDLALDAGSYLLRGPQLPYTIPLSATNGGGTACGLVVLSERFDAAHVPILQSGRQLLTLDNRYQKPLLVRVERTIPRIDVITAADASRIPLFRELFPNEILRREQLTNFASSTMLAVRITDPDRAFETWGDVGAFQRIRDRLAQIRHTIEIEGGHVVRELENQILAAFSQTAKALKVAVSIADRPGQEAGVSDEIPVRAALHRGTAMAMSIDGRTDYIGRAVSATLALLDRPGGKNIVFSAELQNDSEVQSALCGLGLTRPGTSPATDSHGAGSAPAGGIPR